MINFHDATPSTFNGEDCRIVTVKDFEKFKQIVRDVRESMEAGESVPVIIIDSFSEISLSF